MAIPDNLKKTFETDFCGRPLIVETGYIAEQANGAVMLRCGDTVLLVTAVASKAPREGIDFFPLTCDYEEKLYAVGRMPGSFPRREGRPSEAAMITSRMIDRPMRPLFPKDFRNDVQIVATVLSSDQEQDPATLAVTGASCALQISGIPHGGPVACVRVGMLDGQLMLNPTLTQINEFGFGPDRRRHLRRHRHGRGRRASDLRADDARGAAHGARRDPQARRVPARPARRDRQADHELSVEQGLPGDRRRRPRVRRRHASATPHATPTRPRERPPSINSRQETVAALEARFPDARSDIGKAYESEVKKAVRNAILNEGIRPDGRRTDEIRPIWCEVGVLPRTHGSALFTRGQTQALSVVTIGSGQDQQKIDGLGLEQFKRFMHHYNFPPFSVGEARPLRSPGRREIGHGALAERAVHNVMPERGRRSRTWSASSPRSSRATARPRWRRCAARAWR